MHAILLCKCAPPPLQASSSSSTKKKKKALPGLTSFKGLYSYVLSETGTGTPSIGARSRALNK